jgi:hypothetical protein
VDARFARPEANDAARAGGPMIAGDLDLALDLLLGSAPCAACGDELNDGDLVATAGDGETSAPWCLACAREALRALADDRVQVAEEPTEAAG